MMDWIKTWFIDINPSPGGLVIHATYSTLILIAWLCSVWISVVVKTRIRG